MAAREHRVLEELASYGKATSAEQGMSEEDVLRRIKELRGVPYRPGH